MLYSTYTIGGELMHSSKGAEWGKHKYIDKVKTKNGKWRYIYKDFIHAKNKVNYTLNYNTNKKRAKNLEKSSNIKRDNANAYRQRVKELEEAQKYLGVKDNNEPNRLKNLEAARLLERQAESEARAAAEAKRKMEKSTQYQFKTTTKEIGKEILVSALKNFGYDVSKKDIDELIDYIKNMKKG